jgi:hypothetical protein|nr:MAG TPA: hypothetical protein [Caudoviricetes sp.]
MKLNFNFDGKTLLKDWWKIVRDNFTAIQTEHNTLSDKLDTEITQRTNADIGLADKITAEKTARENADSSLQKNINDETKNRQTGDSELQQKISAEITERQTADGKKADKTELYGTDETTKHTITHTLTTSDFVITTDSYDRGTVKIPAETVHSKILLDGSPMPATEVIGTFDCGKSEEDHGDKYVAIAYSPNTGKLDIDVVDIDCAPTDADAIAEINIQYQRAEITKMYHLSHIFYGISSLNDLKTNNKNSFLAAVNEISTKLTTEISDREDAEHSLTEKISTEISDRQAADNELKAKISEINTELTTDNLFYDLSKYVNSDNKLVTDDSGVQYLSYSGSFENGTYLYHNFVVDNFRRKPKTETALELTFNVASRHIAGDGCDIGGLNIGETDVLITYTDTTTERFGQSYYTATDTGDKTITINGTSETYKTTKFKIEIPVKKEIKSISFRIVSDNFYTNGDPTGNACKQKTLIQSAVCYDDECVAVLRDDINANTSKITANTTKITEIDKTVTDISKNQIFVVCDGDHDELKIQAAIDSAPYKSIIYPVGELCVITNANMKSGYGMTGTNNGVAIPLKGGMSLDGSMCDTIMFKNTNPAEKQYIFHLPDGAKMQNVKFTEDTDTVTADTVNPTVLSAQSSSQIISCTFYDIFSTHQFGVSTFEMSNVLFLNNVIDTFAGAPANNLTYEIKIAGNSFVMGNKFLNFTQKEQSLGYMLQASTVIFVNNYMSGFTNCSIDIGKKIVGNIFKTFTDCSIDINGEISDNEFAAITQNTKTPFIYTKGITLISGNRMPVIKINSEYIDFIECGNYAVICGNYMHISAGPTSGQCNLISASSQTLIADNIFRTTASVTANADFSIIYSDGKTVVKNNVTNATSIGTFGDTCVVDGNVTGW